MARPPGRRVVEAHDASGAPLDPARRYTVAANDFIVGGGDFYAAFAEGGEATPAVLDIEALEGFIRGAGGPVSGILDGRVRRVDAP